MIRVAPHGSIPIDPLWEGGQYRFILRLAYHLHQVSLMDKVHVVHQSDECFAKTLEVNVRMEEGLNVPVICLDAQAVQHVKQSGLRDGRVEHVPMLGSKGLPKHTSLGHEALVLGFFAAFTLVFSIPLTCRSQELGDLHMRHVQGVDPGKPIEGLRKGCEQWKSVKREVLMQTLAVEADCSRVVSILHGVAKHLDRLLVIIAIGTLGMLQRGHCQINRVVGLRKAPVQ